MRRVLTVVCSAALAESCAFSAPVNSYTVEEVLADISSHDSKLDGETIPITGWLGPCEKLSCSIYNNRADAERVARFRELPDDEWMPAFGRGLNIGGGSAAFEAQAALLEFSQVVVVGEVNATWKAPPDENGMKFGCWDRCDDIRPQSITLIL